MEAYGRTKHLNILFVSKINCLLTSQEKRESRFYAKATFDLSGAGHGK
jgi:hypothetical protein